VSSEPGNNPAPARIAAWPRVALWATVVVAVLSVAPYLLHAAGLNFATHGRHLDLARAATLKPHELDDLLHRILAGAFVHTILEWTAVAAAFFTAMMAFVHYHSRPSLATPIIGLALLCSGVTDAFHTLAADRLIQATADNRVCIPFTWVISRAFNGGIIVLGAVVSLVLARRGQDPRAPRAWEFRAIMGTGLVFALISYGLIHYSAASSNLPQVAFPDALIRRPWDVGPLVIYVIALTLILPRFYRNHPSVFSGALLVSMLPAIAAQLHMAFGSAALFDAHFHLAHALKVLSYAVPLGGLFYDYDQLQRSNRELAAGLVKKIEEVTTAQAQVVQSQKMAAVGQLAGGVAHEMNNPLGVIIGFTQSLQEGLDEDDPATPPLRTIAREADRCKRLVSDLLLFARKESVEQREDVDINGAVDAASTIVKAHTRGKTIEIVMDEGRNLPRIRANANQVQQVVINLCTNAIDAMPEGGKLTIRTVRSAGDGRDTVALEVADTGTGIPAEVQDRVFEPFFTTKEAGKGVGLGLSLVYQIVQRHEGKVTFTTETGKGTKFTVHWPLAQGAAPAPGRGSGDAPHSAASQ
jgi:two-component system, NtrC family, sensor kinase